MAQQIADRARHPRLVIPRAEHHAIEPREHDGARAHRARLERDVQRAPRRAATRRAPRPPRGCASSSACAVGSCVAYACDCPRARAAAPSRNDHGADRHVTRRARRAPPRAPLHPSRVAACHGSRRVAAARRGAGHRHRGLDAPIRRAPLGAFRATRTAVRRPAALTQHVIAVPELPSSTAIASGFCISRWIGTLERPRAERRVVSLVGEQPLRLRRELERDLALGEQLLQALELQVDDLLDLARVPSGWKMMMSSTRLRNSGLKCCRSACMHLRLDERPVAAASCSRMNWLPTFDVMMIDRVPEVDRAPLRVGQPAVVEDLQQDVEHIGMRLLDLVEQHHRVRAAAHRLGELPALLVARRSPAARR